MSGAEPHSARQGSSGARLVIPIAVGAAVSVALGVYGSAHQPSGESITTLGFSSMIAMKVWLTCAATVFAVVQLLTALRIFGRFGAGSAPHWVASTHRISGVMAVLLTLPVAYHCLWSLGFSDFDTRTLAHSLLGCVFYGAFVAKMLTLQISGLPRWALPLLGGLTFAALIGIWLTSALWYFNTVGIP